MRLPSEEPDDRRRVLAYGRGNQSVGRYRRVVGQAPAPPPRRGRSLNRRRLWLFALVVMVGLAAGAATLSAVFAGPRYEADARPPAPPEATRPGETPAVTPPAARLTPTPVPAATSGATDLDRSPGSSDTGRTGAGGGARDERPDAGSVGCAQRGRAGAPAPTSTSTPAPARAVPPGRDKEPPGQGKEPPGQGKEPPGQGGVPPGQGKEPPGQGKEPPGQGGGPPAHADQDRGEAGCPPGRRSSAANDRSIRQPGDRP